MADFKITRNDELMHYRTKGSKNGVRLYQNPDGSLTPLGERRYRDMYGYGRGDSGVNTAIDAKIQRARSVQTARDPHVSGSQGPSVSGSLKFPYTSREYNQEMLYNTRRNGSSPNVGGNTRTSVSSSPKNASSEYLEELNYNSQKNGTSGTSEKTRANVSSPKKASSEYLEELNYNSKENKKPSSTLPNIQQPKQSTKNESASNWVAERVNDVKKGVSDAYDSASKAVVDAADKVKNGATDAYNKASEIVVDAADKAKDTLDQVYKDVEKWVMTAADDVKNTAGEALDAGKKWVEQAGKDVDKFVDGAVSDVTKAVNDAKNGVANAANAVGKAAQDGFNWVKGLFGGGNKYNDKKR